MSSRSLKVTAAITFLILSSACSELKKVDEMKDNTSEMNETTKKLVGKTEEVIATTKELRTLTRDELLARLEETNRNTATLYDSMRQGDTSALRRASLSQIVRDSSLQGRVAEAGLYLMSFEFQALSGVGHDKDSQRRNLLYQQAMLEFMLKMDELAPKGHRVWPEARPQIENQNDINSEENKAAAFNAIAFTLHKTNRQQHVDPDYGRPMSFYDLIMVALTLKPAIDRGLIVLPEGPHFIKEVLMRPARIEQLLQTRYNMFTYGLLGLTTNLVEKSKWGQAWTLVRSLDIDLSEKTRGTAALLYLFDEVMRPAAQTAEDMSRVGIKPQASKITSFALSRIRFQFHSKSENRPDATVASLVFDHKVLGREEALENHWKRYLRAAEKSPENSRD